MLESPFIVLNQFGEHLLQAREWRKLSQLQLASAAGFHQSSISEFEHGRRLPTLEQAVKLASVLQISLQWFLTGQNAPGTDLADLAFQLHDLGIVDLHVENVRVPGAFRPPEEVVALALAGTTPPARILEAIPAVLAWNSWNTFLLRTFARAQGKRIEARIGWLADIALTIHQGQGFPGGCPAQRALEAYVQHVKPPEEPDDFRFAPSTTPLPPVSLRWKMHYPVSLATFRDRAQRLHDLKADSKRGRHE